MSEHIHRKADEGEDDDLELLRIAALKSINPKKDQPLQYHRSPPSRTPNTHSPQKISSAYSNIPVKQSGNVVNQDNGHMLNVSAQPYYPSPVRNLPMSQSRSIHANVDNFAARQRLEQLDLNEPYVPQRVSGMPPVVPPPHVAPNGVGWMPDPAAMVGTNYTPFPSQKVSDSMPVGVKVQLSPRSMAFVAQNNDILMRRKGENISPNYAYRSPSPPYRSTSPGRWSKSPSPQPKAVSRSPGHRARMHHYVPHRRSVSRSPPPNNHTRSPLPRCRSISRSPLLHQGGPHMSRHQSPNPFHTYSPRSPLAMRQMKLRSPPMHNAKHKASPQRRRISRSPLAHNGRLHSRSPQLPPNGRRSPALLPRQNNRGRRSLSPPHNRKRSPQGPHFHDQGNMPPRYHPNRDRRSPVQLNIRRRSASPLPPLPRHRSHSRSPQRRLPRRSRERNMGVNPLPRRRSPHLLNRRRYEPPTNGFRNNPRARKRSLSPGMKDRPIRRSRTRSLDRNRRINKRPRRSEPEERRGGGGLDDFNRNESRRHDERGVRQNQNQSSSRRDRDEVESKRKEINGTAFVMSNETVVTPVEEKGAKQVDLLARSEVIKEPLKPDTKMSESHSNNAMDIEKQESSDDEEDNDDDDGIDLFASEDSESENEGRFKSSSNKNERKTQAPTVSFAKLGETRSVEVKELADMSANGNRDRERDRNRDRPERSRNNYPGRARGGGGGGIADHQRGIDNARLSRERDRRNKVNVRNGSKNRRDRDRDRERERDKERERERERDRGDRGERGQHVERADRVDRTDRSNRDWDAPLTKGVDDKKASSVTEKPMFKATFQALENEGKTSRKNSRDRDTTDRKTASNRRRNNSKDRRASPDHESGHTATSSTSGNGPSTANATANSTSSRPSSPSSRGLSDAGASSSSKKPIHLRLGAKTNTFKSAKKTPTSPWSGTSHNNNGSGNSNSSKNASTEKV